MRITESQGGWGRKGPLEVVWFNTLAQIGSPRAVFPGPCPDTAFEYLHLWRILNLPGKLCLCSVTLTVKRRLGGASCVSICAHCFWFCHWALLKSIQLCSLYAFSSGIYKLNYICLSLFFSRLNSTNSLSLSSYVKCSCPSVISVALHWALSSSFISLLYWGT